MVRTNRLSMLTGLAGGLVVLSMFILPAQAQPVNQNNGQTQGQTQTPTQALTADQQKAQTAMEEKAMRLVDQVLSDAQSLRLPENKVRVDFTVADMIWVKDEARARTLFSEA